MTSEDAAPTLIDRAPQNLPVPLGAMTAVRVYRPATARRFRRVALLAVAAAAACAAAAGAELLLVPAPVPAALMGGHVQVGSMELDPVGKVPGSSAVLYGGDASYALTVRGDGSARASAAWTSHGSLSSGTCDLQRDGARLIEECTFTGQTGAATSVDVLDPAAGTGWQRTYADGVRVTIAVPRGAAPIPVPFPIGRP